MSVIVSVHWPAVKRPPAGGGSMLTLRFGSGQTIIIGPCHLGKAPPAKLPAPLKPLAPVFAAAYGGSEGSAWPFLMSKLKKCISSGQTWHPPSLSGQQGMHGSVWATAVRGEDRVSCNYVLSRIPFSLSQWISPHGRVTLVNRCGEITSQSWSECMNRFRAGNAFDLRFTNIIVLYWMYRVFCGFKTPPNNSS